VFQLPTTPRPMWVYSQSPASVRNYHAMLVNLVRRIPTATTACRLKIKLDMGQLWLYKYRLPGYCDYRHKFNSHIHKMYKLLFVGCGLMNVNRHLVQHPHNIVTVIISSFVFQIDCLLYAALVSSYTPREIGVGFTTFRGVSYVQPLG